MIKIKATQISGVPRRGRHDFAINGGNLYLDEVLGATPSGKRIERETLFEYDTFIATDTTGSDTDEILLPDLEVGETVYIIAEEGSVGVSVGCHASGVGINGGNDSSVAVCPSGARLEVFKAQDGNLIAIPSASDGSIGGGASGNFLDLDTLSDQVVAGPVEFLQDITVPSGSVILGKDGAKISSAGRSLQYVDARRLPTLFAEYNYDDTGSEQPHYWSFGALQEEFPVAPAIDATIINGPVDLQFQGVLGASMTTAIYIVPTTTGALRLQIWEGSDDTGAVLIDQMFDIPVAGVTEKTRLMFPVPLITDSGDLQFVRFTGLNFHGALQTEGPFIGETVPFLEFDVHLLEKKFILPSDDIVNSVQAGVNVTVDNTDPNNPIVSATGDMGVASVSGDGVDNTDPTNPILSFPNKSEVGLGNVDNTSDADKPVSTATQSALNDKQDILSEGAFVDGDKTKLDQQSGMNTGDQDLSGLALKSNVLELDNTDAFTPDADYEPATKKYVDDNDLGYVLATWGANLQTLGRHPAINSPSNAAEIISLGIMASIPVPATGTIDTITYYNNTGDNTTELQIIKNGVVAYTFTCVGPYGVETGINVPIGFAGSVPDNIAIRYSSGTSPGEGLYTAFIN